MKTDIMEHAKGPLKHAT